MTSLGTHTLHRWAVPEFACIVWQLSAIHGKGEATPSYEALKKFDNEAGRVTRQIRRAQQKIETMQTKVIRVLLTTVRLLDRRLTQAG